MPGESEMLHTVLERLNRLDDKVSSLIEALILGEQKPKGRKGKKAQTNSETMLYLLNNQKNDDRVREKRA